MASNSEPSVAPLPLAILLVAGPKDHGPGEHDYPAWQAAWGQMLGALPDVRVDAAFVWPTAAQWDHSDLVVFYFRNRDWSAAHFRDLENHLERGRGLALLHSAMVASHDPRPLAGLIGISGQRPELQFRHGAVDLVLDSRHDIVDGLETLALEDETYWALHVHPQGVDVLGTAVEAGRKQPQIWTYRRGPGRVFGAIPGHYMTTFDDPRYRRLLASGLAWAVSAPATRFAPFVESLRQVATNQG
ncbi:MAG: ThuA domain-containing protein [Pirellulales bacterium]|nr:ThuA domain-containing protein [Pirellulales bacterium]